MNRMTSVLIVVIAFVLISVSQGRPGSQLSGANRQRIRQRANSHEGLVKAVADYIGKQEAKDRALTSIAQDIKTLLERIAFQTGYRDNGFRGLRLVNGSNEFEGRLEILLDDGVWGSVCDDYLQGSHATALVVCRELGFKGGAFKGVNNAPFGEFVGKVGVHNIECKGDEPTLEYCKFTVVASQDSCAHKEDVGVVCKDPNQAP